jgi:hypothetical protein
MSILLVSVVLHAHVFRALKYHAKDVEFIAKAKII